MTSEQIVRGRAFIEGLLAQAWVRDWLVEFQESEKIRARLGALREIAPSAGASAPSAPAESDAAEGGIIED